MKRQIKMVLKLNLLCVVLLCASVNISFAQVSDAKDEALYGEVSKWMRNLEEKTANLIKNTTVLDTSVALKQLIAQERKTTQIKKIPVRNKVLSRPDLAALVKESTVLFGTAYDCGNCMRTHVNVATGYVLDEDGIIATNHHVVEAYAKANGTKNLAMVVQTSNGEAYLVTEVLASNEHADLCIVRIDTKGAKLKPIPLGPAAKQGDNIYAMTHPNNMLYYFTEGVVARNYMSSASRSQPGPLPEMDITADYAAGSSGGPIVDEKGNLVATVSSTRSIYYNQSEQKNLQMVVKNTKPVISLKKMINWK